MRYTTTTGVGYFEDGQGRVVDYYDVRPGEYEAGEPRSNAVDVDSQEALEPVDDYYLPDPPEKRVDINRKQAFLNAGADAVAARDTMAANGNVPQEVVDFADAQLQMLYLVYVHLAGDSNRIPSFEGRFFQ